MTIRPHYRLGLLAFASVAAVAAATMSLDGQKSSVTATFKQMNVPVDAAFKRFSGSIDFDPARPAQAKAHIDIDTASFDLGDDDYNNEVRKPAWLDTTKYPKASFDASGLAALGGNRYEATGTLSLKGKSQPLKVTLAAGAYGGGSVFDGSFTLSRAAFDIGDAQWKDTVADEVTVKFHIVTAAH